MPTPPKTKRTRKKKEVENKITESAEIKQKDSDLDLLDPPQIPTLYKIEPEKINKPVSAQVGSSATAPEMEMSEDNMKTKMIVLVVLLFVLVGAGGYYFAFGSRFGKNPEQIAKIPVKKIVTDEMYVPKTEKINYVQARLVEQKRLEVPIDPVNAAVEVIVNQAKFTIKDSYSLAVVNAQNWSPDAKLAFIKSLGTITSDGKSSEWQLVFESATKKINYEIIIWEDKIASEKEVAADVAGHDLPNNWYDSSGAIASLRDMPQFAGGTVSAINFFFNEDAKVWVYGLQTSLGGTSMHVL